MEVTFRKATVEDLEFLWNLHKATMKSYVDEIWGWDEEFQREYFSNRFEPTNIEIIIYKSASIGAIEIQDQEKELFITNFEIFPRFQNKGIGSAILKRLINASGNRQESLKLQVLKVNPARRLYKRFGFKTVDKTETHFIMERSVASPVH